MWYTVSNAIETVLAIGLVAGFALGAIATVRAVNAAIKALQ